MSIYLDKMYVNIIKVKLRNFKQKSEFLWNCSCPICGDSVKIKTKARGYIYKGKHGISYTCHNCGVTMSFAKFLKTLDYPLYQQYNLEKFQNNTPKSDDDDMLERAREATPSFDPSTKINLPTIESLPFNHPAKQLLVRRKIPQERFSDLYYAKDFSSFVDEIMPSHSKDLIQNDERIVIPFREEDGSLQGFQGRAIYNSDIRYITIKLNESGRKVFGLDRVDFNRTIYVVEGPIDSMLLDNSIATMDAALYKVIALVGPYDYVFVYDNESRNKAGVKHIEKTISMGHKVVIFPKNIKEKDINDCILNGMSQSDVMRMITENTFEGIRASLEFSNWKKC